MILKNDPYLTKIIENVGAINHSWGGDNDEFTILIKSIVHQQLSNKSATKIYKKLTTTCKGNVTPRKILTLNYEELKKIGLSQNKINCLKKLSLKIAQKEINLNNFKQLNDEEIIKQLTKIKGIGRWTAEMFLIFGLKRPDVFSTTDLGLRKAVQKLFNLKQLPNPKTVEQISQRWKPHRTIAALYLWKWIDQQNQPNTT